MAKFGKDSRSKLDTIDPRLVEVLEAVITNYDIKVISGFRGKDEQSQIFAEGRSKKDWPHSKHNRNAHGQLQAPSMAVDIAPYPIDWDDENDFVYVAGMVIQAAHMLGYVVRWGGDWDMDGDALDDQTFQDLGHFELVV